MKLLPGAKLFGRRGDFSVSISTNDLVKFPYVVERRDYVIE